MLHCVIGVIKNPENQILISQRPKHKVGGGFWEFPGGKVEALETREQALIRELQEEVAITPLSFQDLITFPYTYSNYSVLLDVFLIDQFLGKEKALEGQPLVWAPIHALKEYAFLEANFRIIDLLQNKY